MGLRKVVQQKFWLSVATTAGFTLGLTAAHRAAAWARPGGAWGSRSARCSPRPSRCPGLAVGLGSLYANFSEDNPSRVVSGLGGTLNFLLSLLHIALTTAGLGAVPGLARARCGRRRPRQRRRLARDLQVIAIAAAWILGVTALATWLPLRLGIRHLESIDY